MIVMRCYVFVIKGNPMAPGGTGIGGPTSKPSNLHADPSLPNAFNTNKSVPYQLQIQLGHSADAFIQSDLHRLKGTYYAFFHFYDL